MTVSPMLLRTSCAVCLLVATAGISLAADPTVEQILKIKPTMEDVEIDSPSPESLDLYHVRSIERDNLYGWLLIDADGAPVRRFVSTNGNKKIDRWIYYRNGVEVYRDVDTDHDGIADKAVVTYALVRDEKGKLAVKQSRSGG